MRTHQPVNSHDDLLAVIDNLLQEELGLKRADTGGKVTFAGLDPLRPTVLKTGAASAAAAAVGSVASAILHRQRGGREQDIHIDLRKAFSYQSPWQDVLYNSTRLNGHSIMLVTSPWGGGIVPCRDGRFVLIAAPYPSQKVKVSKLLRCGMEPESLAQATRRWDAADLEAAGQEIQLPISMVRTQAEYRASEQYAYHADTPMIQIEKIGDSAPEPLPPAPRPLSGVRALAMGHVVAGPTVLRQLALQGADCLNINQPGWYEDRNIYVQSDAGMRQAIVDAVKERRKVHDLVRDADVFVENLRPHMAAKQGYGYEELARIRPGIIYVRIKLNTVLGPWADWVGFDFNAGALIGTFTEEGSTELPLTPRGVNVVVDFLCGMMASAGVQAALMRRAVEGGSYLITCTLTQTTMFEMSLGLNDKADLDRIAELGPDHQIQQPNLVTAMTPFGELTRLGSQVEMSETPEYWSDPILVPMGSSLPVWLPK